MTDVCCTHSIRSCAVPVAPHLHVFVCVCVLSVCVLVCGICLCMCVICVVVCVFYFL